ncbi:hypothetical protein GCM10007964_61590 [Sphaerisporangium melleum]|uniref:Uncharacterized protein n=1 Tax=Sphaerisporangium melleum TaxID=321316 RepID=A0A917RKS9_9ACTN|nr:hypothetical protein GCM10007964_61590 [Sphaerisporangium melleum]
MKAVEVIFFSFPEGFCSRCLQEQLSGIPGPRNRRFGGSKLHAGGHFLPPERVSAPRVAAYGIVAGQRGGDW